MGGGDHRGATDSGSGEDGGGDADTAHVSLSLPRTRPTGGVACIYVREDRKPAGPTDAGGAQAGAGAAPGVG